MTGSLRPEHGNRRRSRKLVERPPTSFWQWSGLVVSLFVLAGSRPDVRWVLAPILILFNAGLCFITVLWKRDGRFPLFEIGTLYGAAVLLYSCMPLVNFMAGGLKWIPFSDNRLYYWSSYSTPELVGRFALRYVAYFTAFAVAYLWVRARTERPAGLERTPPAVGTILLLALIGSTGYFLLVRLVYGVDYWASYSDLRTGAGGAGAMPLIVQQVSHNLQGQLIVIKLAFLVFLFAHWRRRLVVRVAIVAWLAIETIAGIARLGGRTELVLLLVAAVCLYHRFARPLSFRIAATGGIFLLLGFMAMGVLRDFGEPQPGDRWPLHAATNEFQALFATAYDIEMREKHRMLEPPPWQVHASDLLMLVPQQVLPVRKVDPSAWYLEATNLKQEGTGLMFGTMGQVSIGFGWIEALVRGAVIGIVFALLHRLYVRHSRDFWVSAFYLYLCVWCYYSFRASSFYWVYFVVYRFLPVMILIWLASRALSAVRRARSIGDVSATPLHSR